MHTVQLARRDLLLATASVAGGLAMPQIMTRAAHADLPMAGVKSPGFKRFRLGEFEVTTLLDGLRPGDGPHPTFGADQPAEVVAALMEANFLPPDKFVNGFTPTLVNTGSELVLFDTGLGEAARPNGLGRLEENLIASGYTPDQVSIVVITHMHGDHIGGLTGGETPAFPNARYVVGQIEYDFWTSPDRAGTPAENNANAVRSKVQPLADRMTFIAPGDDVVPGISSIEAFGHTPGHLIFRLDSGGRQLILTADTANHYVASLQRPDWEVAFDMDKARAAETRKKVFDMIATDRLPFIGYHMPFPAIGYVERLDEGYRYVPATYQFDI
mgnify:FL=1|jgi:glyoxylase-like metal-dependent hydrolase (beta-lactamase superfamily II)